MKKNTRLNQFYSRNLNITGEFKFNEISGDKIEITSGEINKVDLSFSKIESLIIQSILPPYNELNIQNLKCSGISIEKEMHLSTAKINNFSFNVFTKSSESRVKFYNLLLKGDFEVINSNLDQVEFLGIDFYNAKLKFESTYLQQAIFANIIWPKDRALFPNLVSTKLNLNGKRNQVKSILPTYNFQIESYRQLKSVSFKNNNIIDALGFYKNEMRVYYTFAVTMKSESWWDRLLIWLNMCISNFGQSYMRPLLWLFSVHYIFYQMLVGWQFSFKTESIIQGISYYFYLLNPLHKNPESFQDFDFVIDFFMRVVGGYFIYHFIKASRKFGKI